MLPNSKAIPKELTPPINKNTYDNSTPQDSEALHRKKKTCTHNNQEHLTDNIEAQNTINTKQTHAPLSAGLRKELNRCHFTMEGTLVNMTEKLAK